MRSILQRGSKAVCPRGRYGDSKPSLPHGIQNIILGGTARSRNMFMRLPYGSQQENYHKLMVPPYHAQTIQLSAYNNMHKHNSTAEIKYSCVITTNHWFYCHIRVKTNFLERQQLVRCPSNVPCKPLRRCLRLFSRVFQTRPYDPRVLPAPFCEKRQGGKELVVKDEESCTNGREIVRNTLCRSIRGNFLSP